MGEGWGGDGGRMGGACLNDAERRATLRATLIWGRDGENGTGDALHDALGRVAQ